MPDETPRIDPATAADASSTDGAGPGASPEQSGAVSEAAVAEVSGVAQEADADGAAEAVAAGAPAPDAADPGNRPSASARRGRTAARCSS